jgi:hypothetical protein
MSARSISPPRGYLKFKAARGNLGDPNLGDTLEGRALALKGDDAKGQLRC